jgi:hypothetical protein
MNSSRTKIFQEFHPNTRSNLPPRKCNRPCPRIAITSAPSITERDRKTRLEFEGGEFAETLTIAFCLQHRCSP